MYDSDSDDSLLAAPTFKKKTRKDENQTRKANQILDQALKDYDKNLQQQALIQILKREEVDQDALLSKAQNIQDNAASLSKNNTGANKRRKLTLDGLASDDENDDGALDAERFQALMHAKDTEISSGLGMRVTLFSTCSSSSSNDLPKTSSQAVEALKEILLVQNNIDDKASATPVLKWIDKHIKDNTLVECLNGSNFINQCQTHQISKLPRPLVQWLYAVACSGKGRLSVGAFETLSQLLTDNIGVHPFLSLQDLSKQLHEWFGLKDEPTKEAAATITTTPTSSTVPILSVHAAKGLDHFLILWELALRQGMVVYEAETVLAHSTECLPALFAASLDKVFHSPKGHIGLWNSGQTLLRTLLDLYTEAAKDDKEGFQKWLEVTAVGVASYLSKQGAGAAGSEDQDDTGAWLCQSMAIRFVMLETKTTGPHAVAAEFRMLLSKQVLSRVCCFQQDSSSSKMEQEIESILSSLQLPQEVQKSTRWQALGTSRVALDTLEKLVADAINLGPNDSPKCLAVLEASYFSLQAAMTLFDAQHFLDLKDDDSDLDQLDDAAQAKKTPERIEKEAIFDIFEQFEAQTQTISSLTRRDAMNNPHFRRINYFVTCIRVYVRLHKAMFQSRRQPKSIGGRGSLDSWVTSKKPDRQSLQDEPAGFLSSQDDSLLGSP